MKIDRLIAIITILLQKEKVTTSDLAKRFEVSNRTIQRDIEDICRAGIPIVSMQGYDGGLSIAAGYKIDKTLLTETELNAIFTGLKSIESVSKTTYTKGLMEKFTYGKNTILTDANRIIIDLASFYQVGLTDKIELIKQAIINQETILFRYYSDNGESDRTIEPYYLVFRWFAWYVYGYCLTKQDYRLFKLNRISELKNLNTVYEERHITNEKLNFDSYIWQDDIKLTALFDVSVKYRLIDDYGPACFTFDDKTGKLLFENIFTNLNYLVQWILSYGDTVKVIEPIGLINEIRKNAKNILTLYE